MLNADGIRKQSDSLAASFEVSKFPCTVKIGGVPYYMVVNMPAIGVGANNKGIVSFQKAPGKLIAYSISFFGSDFSRLKRLAHLVGDNVVVLFPACYVIIAAFR